MNKKFVDWIADADEYIQGLWFDWNFLWDQHSANTVSGTREYAKPSDLGSWDRDSFYLDYTDDDAVHLKETSYPVWRAKHRQGTQTNDTPGKFIITPEGNIYLHAIPDAVYVFTADYWRTPTRMTVDASTSDIPTRYERIIIDRAKTYYAEHEEFPVVMESASREYDSLLDRLEGAELPGKTHMKWKSQNNSDLRIVVE